MTCTYWKGSIMNRKKRNKKYVFIDSNNIRRCTYDVKREFAFNDFDNVYYQKGFETIDGIFEANEIPEEYRKVIIEVDDAHIEYGAEEVFTKVPFYISQLGATENGLFIKANAEATDVTNWVSIIDEDFIPENYDQVIIFMNRLNEMGLLGNYMNSILDFFRTKLMVQGKEYHVATKEKGKEKTLTTS